MTGDIVQLTAKTSSLGRTLQPGAGAGVCAVVLAAGRSSRMGDANKLLLDWGGKPLVRAVVETALEAPFGDVLVVLGHQGEEVRKALEGCAARFVENPNYAAGLSTSVRCGVESAAAADGWAFLLGDMPGVRLATLAALVAAFAAVGDDGAIAVPVWKGERGNPVLLGRSYREALRSLEGDQGARPLLRKYAAQVVEVAVEDEGVRVDVDTPELYGRAREAL